MLCYLFKKHLGDVNPDQDNGLSVDECYTLCLINVYEYYHQIPSGDT